MDYARSIQQTSDGGYIVAGTTSSNDGDVTGNHGDGDIWVVKLSPTGDIQWQRCFGGSNLDSASSIQQTSDGGFVFSGSTGSYDGDVIENPVRMGFWIVKIPNTIPTPISPSRITLHPGWNFISIPKYLTEGNNTAAIFAGVDTAGRSIFLYNASSEFWKAMTQTSPVTPLDALWIFANETTYIPLDYASGAVQVPPSKQLYEGWNAMGFSSITPITARDALITISPKWGQVIGWNAEIQTYDTVIIRDGSGAYSDTREMMPMKGYWIAMTEPGVLYGLS
jgi:hypothetical protein